MAKLGKSIVIVAAKRTAFGTMNGALKGLSATDLGVVASKAALAQSGVSAEDIGHVIFGNVQQTSPDAIYCARHIGLKSGLPITTPALTVNRLCGSGFQAIINGAEQLLLGETNAVLVGGTENMSQAPHVLRGGREGWAFGKPPQVEDTLWSALTDSYNNTPMAVTAENLATKYGISRAECDAYALESQKRWAAAQEKGIFKDEITPLEIQQKKATVTFDKDEHPRPADHAGDSREAAARVQKRWRRDGRQRIRHLRRRRRARPRDGRIREAKRLEAARAHHAMGRRRRRPEHHGDRPGPRDQERALTRGSQGLGHRRPSR